jgi:hypothetical protein
MNNSINIKFLSWIVVPAMMFCDLAYAQEVLTKVNGGASWKYMFSAESIELLPSSGAFNYVTNNQDYTVIDRNNGTSKTILLHDGTPGLDVPPHGMILNIVNRSNTQLPFNAGGAGGYEGIDGNSYTVNVNLLAHSSITLQWDAGSSRWYEIL